MKYAIISDIHSNLEALHAVLRHIHTSGDVDKILCCGDVVGYYADPAACISTLQNGNIQCIRGNHDIAVAGIKNLKCNWKVAQDAIKWTRETLNENEIDYLRQLPSTHIFKTGENNHCILFHGAMHPKENAEELHMEKDSDILLSFGAMINLSLKIGFFGHTHKPMLYESYPCGYISSILGEGKIQLSHDSKYLINPGSVGQARDTKDHRASYLTYESTLETIEFHKVDYDRKTTLKKAKAAGLLEKSLISRYTTRIINKLWKTK